MEMNTKEDVEYMLRELIEKWNEQNPDKYICHRTFEDANIKTSLLGFLISCIDGKEFTITIGEIND